MTSTVVHAKKYTLLAVNDRGYVIGEQHQRAKLTDRQVDLVRDLLDARADLMGRLRREGVCKPLVQRALVAAGLDAQSIAARFGVSRRTIRDIDSGTIRAQLAVDYRRNTRGG